MRVLMVCLGNICRSPMAESVLARLRPDWQIDSAGMGSWHVGHRPDPRTLAVLTHHGLSTSHRARQVTLGDFTAFDLLLGMDASNVSALKALRPQDAAAEVRLLDASGADVPDPYHDEVEAFEQVYA